MRIIVDPKKPEKIIKDLMSSMLQKVRYTGTSQDDEEKVTYHDIHSYKGYACMIARIPKRKKYPKIDDILSHVDQIEYNFKGMAKELYPNILYHSTLETPLSDSLKNAGKELHRLIDIDRKNK